MSLTNAQVIEAALRDCGVIAETDSASPEQGRIGLDRLNRMLMDWAVTGIDFGYFPQASASDTCPIPSWAEKGVISKLAQALQLVYPSQGGSPLLYDNDENGYATILRVIALDKLQPLDARNLGGRLPGWGYDITTDTVR